MIEFFRKHGEWMTLPLAILAWVALPNMMRMVDPEAGAHDPGVVMKFILAAVGFLFAIGLAWLTLRITSHPTYKVFDEFLKREGGNLTAWERAKFGLVFYFGLLFFYGLLVVAL